MKKIFVIIFCGAMTLLMYSCTTCPPCYPLTAEDSLLLERYKAIIAAASKTDAAAADSKSLSASITIISKDTACHWIGRYMADPMAKSKVNAYISAEDAMEILLTGRHVPSGLFLQRGTDTTGVVHWLAWEEFSTGTEEEDTVYVLTDKTCMCKPCCADPGTDCH